MENLELTNDELAQVYGGQEDEAVACEEVAEAAVM
jgi:bacteriocin-like protein